jgi:hypothetical protein
MRSLELARDDDTFGFVGMTHSKNQSGSRSIVVIPSRTCEESHPRQLLPMFAGMRSLDLARDDNTSGMRSLDLARDDNTVGFAGMTHSNNQSGSRSVVVIPRRTCEESHPRQSMPMFAGMRSLELARDDNTFGFVGMTHSNNQSGSRSVVVIPSRTCEESHPRQSLPMCAGMRSLELARDDDTSGMRSLDLARDDDTVGFAGMTHSKNQSGSRSIVVIPSRTCEESHPRQSLPMCAGMRSLDLARDDDTSGMRSLDLARDENTFGFAGMTHSNNQSGSRSIVVIPRRTCEESHPRQSLPMCAGMRSLGVARMPV